MDPLEARVDGRSVEVRFVRYRAQTKERIESRLKPGLERIAMLEQDRRLARRAHRLPRPRRATRSTRRSCGGARWAYVFGSALLVIVHLQAITGWQLDDGLRAASHRRVGQRRAHQIRDAAAGSCAVCTTSARRPWSSCSALHMLQVGALRRVQEAARGRLVARPRALGDGRWASRSPVTCCPGIRKATGRRASPRTSPARCQWSETAIQKAMQGGAEYGKPHAHAVLHAARVRVAGDPRRCSLSRMSRCSASTA